MKGKLSKMDEHTVYWMKQAMEEVQTSFHWLHPNEKEVLSKFKFAKKRNDWLLGRWTAKKAIKQFLSNDWPTLSLTGIEIRRADDGAPEPYFNNEPLPVYISLSHSNGIGLCTISSTQIIHGCDVEKIEPRSDEFISDYLTLQERNILARNPDKIKPLIANIIWSAKESTLKLLRKGLSIDTRKVKIESIDHDATKPWNEIKIIFEPDNKEFFGHWSAKGTFIYTMVTGEKRIKPIEL